MPPPHLLTDLAERAGHLDWVEVREPKARPGRREVRRLWALADPEVTTYVGSSGTHQTAWPHVQPGRTCSRSVGWTASGYWCGRAGSSNRIVKEEHEVTYAITSLPPTEATAARLLHLNRGHWGIENRLHHIRDVTFDEDRCQVRGGAAPQTLAACRNLVLALLRRRPGGCENVAAALRTYAARPHQAVALLSPLYPGEKTLRR